MDKSRLDEIRSKFNEMLKDEDEGVIYEYSDYVDYVLYVYDNGITRHEAETIAEDILYEI